MKLPDKKTLRKEDMPDAPKWIDPIIDAINSMAESIYNAFNKRISLTDNINAQVYTHKFKYNPTTNGTTGELIFPKLKFQKTVVSRVAGLFIGQIIEYDNDNMSQVMKVPVSLDWHENSGIIVVNNITGLTQKYTYVITFIVLGY